MIVEAILNFFIDLASSMLEVFPSIAAPDLSEFMAALDGLWSRLGWANHFIAIDQVVVCLGLMVTWWATLHGVKLVVYVLTKAHVLGGSSE